MILKLILFNMYFTICCFNKSFDNIGFIYTIPINIKLDIKIGQIVQFPFKNTIDYGIVLNISQNIKIDFDRSKIKNLISIKNKNIFISNYRVDLIKWIGEYYFCLIHNSFNLFFPKNLKEKILKNKLIFDVNNKYKYFYKNNKKLSNSQNKVYKNISNSKNNINLLYGVTGSGKTEIYIKLIKDNLDKNKQSLLLIPEIILTNQISEKIKKVFGEQILVINSTLTDLTKTKYWLDINICNAKIIIGTRSALFYPYNNLGLIIIDEEHDNSYISDKTPRYNSIEVAEKITKLNGNKLVLGSGTPSINSMYKGVKGEYNLINLLETFKKSD